MPDIALFGYHDDASDITSSVRSAFKREPYAHQLTFIREPREAMDVAGRPMFFVRVYATKQCTYIQEIVRVLNKLEVDVEVVFLDHWSPAVK